MRGQIVLGAVFAVLFAWSGSAAAEKKRVGVPKFDGAQEAVVRKAVMQVLKGDGYEVVGGGEINSAAKSAGVQLDSNEGYKTVAKELSISSFVTGDVSKKKAKLVVRNGADGSVSGEGAFGGANAAKIAADVRDGFSRRLGSAVERGRAPSGAKKPVAAAPVAEADDGADDAAEAPAKPTKTAAASKSDDGDKADKSEKDDRSGSDEAPPPSSSGADETVARKAPEPAGSDSGEMGPRALDVAAALGGTSRSLTYNQDVFGTLRQYKLALGPVFNLHVIAYPAAFATSGFVANLGLELDVNQGFGVTSSVASGANYNTIIHDYYGGARARFLLGGGHELAAFVGGGEHAFAFRDGPDPMTDNRMNLNIPDTIYRYLRVGVDTRFELPSGMTLGLEAAYRRVLNQGGQIADPGFFPYLTVAGVDANAMLGYHITPSIEARFNFNVRRYFYAMNSSPDKCMSGCDFDQNGNRVNSIAGGAVDQYIGFTFGAAYVFGGVAPGAVPVSEEPAPAADEAPKPKKKAKKKKASDDEDSGNDSSGGGDEGGSDSDG